MTKVYLIEQAANMIEQRVTNLRTGGGTVCLLFSLFRLRSGPT